MSKPSIIFIPGSYVLLPVYQPLFDGISKAGYEIRGIHPPTVGLSSRQGRDGPAPSMYDDATVIAQEAEKLADQGRNVILMGHSYAGIPMSQSTKGLGKEERKAQGKPGGIVRLAYISSLVPAVGNSAGSLLSRFPDQNRPLVSIDVSVLEGKKKHLQFVPSSPLSNNNVNPCRKMAGCQWKIQRRLPE